MQTLDLQKNLCYLQSLEGRPIEWGASECFQRFQCGSSAAARTENEWIGYR